MNSGSVDAWHYATREPVRITWKAGKISALSVPDKPPPENLWLAPSLLDLQINGYAGVDFQQDDLAAGQLLNATRALRRDGCARYFLTLITDEWPRMMARLEHYGALRRNDPELQDAIRGFHIEGPFLSRQPGFCGAHNPAVMLEPQAAHIEELRAVAKGVPLLLTIAPEVPGALEAIRLAASLGITVSLGHTDATSEILRAAAKAGATGFTHLANGCPRELDRQDKIIWRVADLKTLPFVSLIPDGIHVSPSLFRLLLKHFQSERTVYFTTDAMAAAGAMPGPYRIGRLHVEVGSDGIVRHPGQTNFAGSALRPMDGITRAAEMLGRPWQSCWNEMSTGPAAFVKMRDALEPGHRATFYLVEPQENKLKLNCCWHGEWTAPVENA